ncbi:3282_t:CDS:2, partial [Racocetra fulgida]
AECEYELNIYLTSILEELITEKSQEINTIDQIMKNQKGIGTALQAESANELIQ